MGGHEHEKKASNQWTTDAWHAPMRAPEEVEWPFFSDPSPWTPPIAKRAAGQTTQSACDVFSHYAEDTLGDRRDGSYTVEKLDAATGTPSGEVDVRFPDAGRDERAKRYGVVPKDHYQLIVRSYAPFERFGGMHCDLTDAALGLGLFCGDYEGDDRGPSTSLGASSRITEAVTFSLNGHGAITSNAAWSDPSRGHGPVPRALGFFNGVSPSHPLERTANPSSAAVMVEAGREKIIAATLAGAMPLAPKAPEIDVTAAARFRQEGDVLIVTGELHGDAFPNAEVLLRDARGNVVLIHSFATSRGRITGPLLGLPGGDPRPMGRFERRIEVTKDGSLATSATREACDSHGGK